MIWLFLFLADVQAATAPLAWELEFSARPEAAFFDANSASIFVSLAEEGDSARVDRVSLEGKLLKKGLARGQGRAGALRAYDGKIYWVVGRKVLRFTADGKEKEEIAELAPTDGPIGDIAVDRTGLLYLGLEKGGLLALAKNVRSEQKTKLGIFGLFLDRSRLYVLTGNEVRALSDKKIEWRCPGICHGLERTSAGRWLSVNGNKIVEQKRKTPLLESGDLVGRIGYVYRRDSQEDLLLLPLVAGKKLRAYLPNSKK